MIIEVVRIGDRLVGKRFRDRWNLAQLGFSGFNMEYIRAEMREFRRISGGDFLIDTVPGNLEAITDEERSMFGRHVARVAA